MLVLSAPDGRRVSATPTREPIRGRSPRMGGLGGGEPPKQAQVRRLRARAGVQARLCVQRERGRATTDATLWAHNRSQAAPTAAKGRRARLRYDCGAVAPRMSERQRASDSRATTFRGLGAEDRRSVMSRICCGVWGGSPTNERASASE